MFRNRLLHPFYAPDGAGGTGAGDGAGAGTGTGEQTGTGNGSGQGDGNGSGQVLELPKTQEELAALLKSETEKVVKSTQDQLEKDIAKKIEEAKAEGERLAKLSAAEREKEQTKKQQDELDKKEKELVQKELELKTVDLLKEKSLPLDFKPYILGADEAATKEKVEAFSKLWQTALEQAVNEKLKGNTPFYSKGAPATGAGFFDAITKNQLRK